MVIIFQFYLSMENLKEFLEQKNSGGAKEFLLDFEKRLSQSELTNADAGKIILQE